MYSATEAFCPRPVVNWEYWYYLLRDSTKLDADAMMTWGFTAVYASG